VTLLEVRLREGDSRIRAVERGWIEIEIYEAAIRIKYILNGALDIKEPVIKVTLCELIVW
jgi:hypothetical protein